MKQHTNQTIGVLIANLGTPDAPTPVAVRKYLAEFLIDPRVVEIPKLLWWPILHGIVLRTRPKKSAALYQAIWTPEGSPLLKNSQNLVKNLQQQLNTEIKIVLGMRYGNPSIASALEELRQQQVQKLIVLPLYPQYSATTTASTFDAVTAVLKKWRYIPELHLISDYYHQPEYITALTDSIKQHWNQQGAQDHLLFSFHGLPQRFCDAGDPYESQCHQTAELVAKKLELAPENWSIAFQSRFGRAKWLQPYCDATLQKMPSQDIKNVSVICPGFAVDCLETLEEIAQQNRDVFLKAGGEKFTYIPALNDSPAQIELLEKLLFDNNFPMFRI